MKIVKFILLFLSGITSYSQTTVYYDNNGKYLGASHTLKSPQPKSGLDYKIPQSFIQTNAPNTPKPVPNTSYSSTTSTTEVIELYTFYKAQVKEYDIDQEVFDMHCQWYLKRGTDGNLFWKVKSGNDVLIFNIISFDVLVQDADTQILEYQCKRKFDDYPVHIKLHMVRGNAQSLSALINKNHKITHFK